MPEHAKDLMKKAQEAVNSKWKIYESLAKEKKDDGEAK